MREESHLDDMRAAIRGDFERLEERRGEQELMRPVAVKADESELPPEVEAASHPEPEPDDQPPDAGESPRRSWLDRLLGR